MEHESQPELVLRLPQQRHSPNQEIRRFLPFQLERKLEWEEAGSEWETKMEEQRKEKESEEKERKGWEKLEEVFVQVMVMVVQV